MAAALTHEVIRQPLSTIDVSNPVIYEEDTWRPLFARLRRDAPVHYCAESRFGPYWSVTRYNDIMTVELDHATYSSQLGGIQVEDQPANMKRGSFIRMDPPRHTAQRRTVAPVASPNNLASYEITIRQRTRAVLDALPRNETFDWVDKVSIELTTMMLATLFDFPWEDRRKLSYWSDVWGANVAAPDAPVRSDEERFAELDRMGLARPVAGEVCIPSCAHEDVGRDRLIDASEKISMNSKRVAATKPTKRTNSYPYSLSWRRVG